MRKDWNLPRSPVRDLPVLDDGGGSTAQAGVSGIGSGESRFREQDVSGVNQGGTAGFPVPLGMGSPAF